MRILKRLKQDYILDKSQVARQNCLMVSKPHVFFDLAGGRDAWAIFRMSLLIEASSFLVGTCSNNFFLPLSIGGVL
jgi:hypothetical protein